MWGDKDLQKTFVLCVSVQWIIQELESAETFKT